jgi:hypothetical protein
MGHETGAYILTVIIAIEEVRHGVVRPPELFSLPSFSLRPPIGISENDIPVASYDIPVKWPLSS